MIASSYNKISLIWKSGNQIGRWTAIPQNVMFSASQESVICMFTSISLKVKPWTLCIPSNTYPTTSTGMNILKPSPISQQNSWLSKAEFNTLPIQNQGNGIQDPSMPNSEILFFCVGSTYSQKQITQLTGSKRKLHAGF